MYEKAVSGEIILLIEQLAKKEQVSKNFYLAGGTGLALQFGHRLSNDLDLFTQKALATERLIELVLSMNGRVSEHRDDTIISFINNIKTSFFYYPYQLIEPLKDFKGMPLASVKDIACMKVIAISQRGDKKDFYDLYEILKHISMEEIKILLAKKYPEGSLNFYHIIRALCYFEEADRQPDPVSLNNTKWIDVKDFFIKNEKRFSRIFLEI